MFYWDVILTHCPTFNGISGVISKLLGMRQLHSAIWPLELFLWVIETCKLSHCIKMTPHPGGFVPHSGGTLCCVTKTLLKLTCVAVPWFCGRSSSDYTTDIPTMYFAQYGGQQKETTVPENYFLLLYFSQLHQYHPIGSTYGWGEETSGSIIY